MRLYAEVPPGPRHCGVAARLTVLAVALGGQPETQWVIPSTADGSISVIGQILSRTDCGIVGGGQRLRATQCLAGNDREAARVAAVFPGEILLAQYAGNAP